MSEEGGLLLTPQQELFLPEFLDGWRVDRLYGLLLPYPQGPGLRRQRGMIALEHPTATRGAPLLYKGPLSKFKPYSLKKRPKSRSMTHPGNRPSLLARVREARSQGAWVQV